MRLAALIIAFVIAAAGCRTADQSNGEPIIETTGTVQYVDLEGGFYGLIGEDGTRYDPIELDEAYMEDGLQVRFRAERQENVVTIRMWGEPVRILEIERL